MSTENLQTLLAQVEVLVKKYHHLDAEYQALLQQQVVWQQEKKDLLVKHRQVTERVEAMILKLNALEQKNDC